VFERLSTIYISRNIGVMIFASNKFERNVGTFGGAISINSPDFQYGYSNNNNLLRPLVIIADNIFNKNMAYFSGNAVYIRNTLPMRDLHKLCVGVLTTGNYFGYNIGLKKHNGGAMTIVCDIIPR
jgi:hypothetical protein